MASTAGECNKACSGAGNEICGRTNRLNVFEAVTAKPTTTSTSTTRSSTSTTTSTSIIFPCPMANAWLSCGFCESSHNKRLSRDSREMTKMTVESCQSTCYAAGYTYAGVEFGKECWCGKALQGPSVNPPIAATECSVACTGNNNLPSQRLFFKLAGHLGSAWVSLGHCWQISLSISYV